VSPSKVRVATLLQKSAVLDWLREHPERVDGAL
jgi:hypothetical protein